METYADLADTLSGRKVYVERLTSPGGELTGSARVQVLGRKGGILAVLNVQAFSVARFADRLARLFPLSEFTGKTAREHAERLLSGATHEEQAKILSLLVLRRPSEALEVIREATGKS